MEGRTDEADSVVVTRSVGDLPFQSYVGMRQALDLFTADD